jgi:hypothetical protein
MKRSQIVLFTVFLALTGIIYIVIDSNKKEFSKTIKTEKTTEFVPVRKVKNKMRRITLVSYGQITPNAEIMISFEVQGKLEKGDITMKPGINFRKGQILFKLNNAEAFYTLSSRKSSLSNLILNALPDIELDFPSERNKWVNFLNNLKPANILPALPEVSSGKERMFLTSRNIISEYYNLKSLEARMEKYFYSAPFSGTVITLYAEPGSIANPGAQIAKIAKAGDYEVKVPISMTDLSLYKEKSTAEFTNSSYENIATGKIIRISNVINQQTQSADVYYSIKPLSGKKLYNGMFVNVAINREAPKETMTLPRVAVKNGKVNILDNTKVTSRHVTIVSSKPDSVFVTGLKDGHIVVLEQMMKIDKSVNYEGIFR